MATDIAIREISGAVTGQSIQGGTAGGRKAAPERAPAKEEPEAKKDLPSEALEKVASEIQIQLKRINTELRFEVDGASGELVVKIIDPDDQQVIRQIPSEELLAIRARMDDLIGVLYSTET
jgi:flagellar protein FlaG